MKAILVMVFFLISQGAYSDIRVKVYDQMTEYQKAGLGDYIHGVGVGISWTKLYASKLFCPPENLAVTRENYLQILKARIDKIRGNEQFYENTYVELELINGLIDTFPCK